MKQVLAGIALFLILGCAAVGAWSWHASALRASHDAQVATAADLLQNRQYAEERLVAAIAKKQRAAQKAAEADLAQIGSALDRTPREVVLEAQRQRLQRAAEDHALRY